MIQDTLTYKVADDVSEICKPLFDAFNLNYFVYAKVYSDNTMSLLLSDRSWYKYYVENRYPVMGTSGMDGIYSWDTLMPSKAIKDGCGYFNHHQGVVVFKKHQNFVEQLEFASSDKSNSVMELCLNNPDLLERFIFYFKDKAANLIMQSEKERFVIPDAMCKKFSETKSYEVFCELIKTKNVCLSFKSKEIMMTKREYDVLSQLAQGKTAKEVARTLNISPRTIEAHIVSIKDKSNCTFKSQLIDAINDSAVINRRG